MTTEVQQGVMHFVIEGEDYTNIVRDMWISEHPRNALHSITEGLPDISQEQALDILTGKAKLTGRSDSPAGELYLVPDNAKEYHGVGLYTPKQLVKLMEQHLREKEAEYYKETEYARRQIARGTRGLVSKDDRFIGEAIAKGLREMINQLVVLYPIIGKSVSEMPIFRFDVANELLLESYGVIESRHEDAYDEREKKPRKRINPSSRNARRSLPEDEWSRGRQEPLKYEWPLPKSKYRSGFSARGGDKRGYSREKRSHRMFPNTHTKRKVTTEITSWTGIAPGAKHYYVKLVEEDNPFWDGKYWRTLREDAEYKGKVVKQQYIHAERAVKMVDVLFKENFDQKTHEMDKGSWML